MISSDNKWLSGILSQVQLGDKRLVTRLGEIIQAAIKSPASSIPEANKTRKKIQAAYRFFDNEKSNAEEIRDAFFKYTSEKISDQEMVIIATDTVEISYSKNRKNRVGGYILKPGTNGVFLHTGLVINRGGVTQGTIFQKHWTRDDKDFGKSKKCAQKDIEEKESYCWIECIDAVEKHVPENVTAFVTCDRGGDIYEALTHERRSNIHLLIRATHNRSIDDKEHPYLFDAVKAEPVAKKITVTVRAKQHKTREATLEVRFRKASIKRPQRLNKKKDKYPDHVDVTIIFVSEINVPVGEEHIEWKLITTANVDSAEMAVQCIKIYALRWIIERYHYTLKSGCCVEELQLQTFERLERALAIYSIVAWRIMHMTYIARENPEAPCTIILDDDEWKALCCCSSEQAIPPSEPPTVKQAVLLIAKLGGFMGRKGDGFPGLKVIWRGMKVLKNITHMYCVMREKCPIEQFDIY